MKKHEIMDLIDTIIEDSRTAVLATVDQNGTPHLRWVTPGRIQDRSGAIFMISAQHLSKVAQIRHNPSAELMIQTRALDKIINLKGKINLLDNPSIRSEALESIGHYLHTFWNLDVPETGLVVLELIIDQAVLYFPQKGNRVNVDFAGES